MKDHKLFILVGAVFIQLGLSLPFYLPGGEWGMIPFGLSFLADGGLLLFLGMIGWGYNYLERARREDWSETYEEVRRIEL